MLVLVIVLVLDEVFTELLLVTEELNITVLSVVLELLLESLLDLKNLLTVELV